MFTGSRFPDSCNGTSNPVQQLTDLVTYQQPKIIHPGTSPEKPDRDSKKNSIKCPRSATNIGTDSLKRLRENSLRARRSYFGAVLKRRLRLARIIWCNIVRDWDLQNWRRVWFCDESRFILQKRDGRTRVYRRRNKRFTRSCVLEVDNFGGGSVMMFGAIFYARKCQLVHIPGNLNAARKR